tara:strand:+ start:320 stop:490 length:171 start_codon:yes stop_codon:yes gene_type:complete
MNRSIIAIFVYVIGILFGALFLDVWSPETGPKALLGVIWTSLFLIALFYTEQSKNY